MYESAIFIPIPANAVFSDAYVKGGVLFVSGYEENKIAGRFILRCPLLFSL